MSSSCAPFFIDVESRTWSRETHNLFDFEAKSNTITSQAFTMRDSSTCVRTGDEIDVCSHTALSEPLKAQAEKLIQVEWRQGKAYLNRPRWGTVDDRRVQRCWKLIRNINGAAPHRLAEGDIVKFGRSQFRVRQLSAHPQAVAFDTQMHGVCHVDAENFDELADTSCRICLATGSCEEDPLIAPCQCKGSIRHIHLGCLKHWVRDRLGLSDGESSFVVGGAVDALSCELCKSPYQTSVQMGKETLPLIEVNSPFVVLESCNDRRLHVLPIQDGKAIKIGRGHECNLSIHDTSISRVQASVDFCNGVFILSDQNSRFGTYIKITKQMPLEIGEQFSVQVGRTILQLSTKRADEASSSESIFSSSMSPAASLRGDDTDVAQSPRGSSSVAGADDFGSCGDGR